MNWLTWQTGDPAERKQAVWREHKRTRLDETLREVLEWFGEPEPVPEAWAIREVRK